MYLSVEMFVGMYVGKINGSIRLFSINVPSRVHSHMYWLEGRVRAQYTRKKNVHFTLQMF